MSACDPCLCVCVKAYELLFTDEVKCVRFVVGEIISFELRVAKLFRKYRFPVVFIVRIKFLVDSMHRMDFDV